MAFSPDENPEIFDPYGQPTGGYGQGPNQGSSWDELEALRRKMEGNALEAALSNGDNIQHYGAQEQPGGGGEESREPAGPETSLATGQIPPGPQPSFVSTDNIGTIYDHTDGTGGGNEGAANERLDEPPQTPAEAKQTAPPPAIAPTADAPPQAPPPPSTITTPSGGIDWSRVPAGVPRDFAEQFLQNNPGDYHRLASAYGSNRTSLTNRPGSNGPGRLAGSALGGGPGSSGSVGQGEAAFTGFGGLKHFNPGAIPTQQLGQYQQFQYGPDFQGPNAGEYNPFQFSQLNHQGPAAYNQFQYGQFTPEQIAQHQQFQYSQFTPEQLGNYQQFNYGESNLPTFEGEDALIRQKSTELLNAQAPNLAGSEGLLQQKATDLLNQQGPDYGAEEGMQRQLLQSILQNPTSLNDLQVQALKERNKEEALGYSKQIGDQLRQSAASRGALQGGNLAASERRLMQDAATQTLKGNRDIDLEVAGQRFGQRLQTLGAADSALGNALNRGGTLQNQQIGRLQGASGILSDIMGRYGAQQGVAANSLGAANSALNAIQGRGLAADSAKLARQQAQAGEGRFGADYNLQKANYGINAAQQRAAIEALQAGEGQFASQHALQRGNYGIAADQQKLAREQSQAGEGRFAQDDAFRRSQLGLQAEDAKFAREQAQAGQGWLAQQQKNTLFDHALAGSQHNLQKNQLQAGEGQFGINQSNNAAKFALEQALAQSGLGLQADQFLESGRRYDNDFLEGRRQFNEQTNLNYSQLSNNAYQQWLMALMGGL